MSNISTGDNVSGNIASCRGGGRWEGKAISGPVRDVDSKAGRVQLESRETGTGAGEPDYLLMSLMRATQWAGDGAGRSTCRRLMEANAPRLPPDWIQELFGELWT